MNLENNTTQKVGVIVGRFQVPDLIEGYKDAFEMLNSKAYNTNIVVLAVPAPAIKATKSNPLDFDSRRRMIEETYPGKFTIMYIKDCQNDLIWSKNLDLMISDIAGNRDVDIYGTKENFIKHYVGKFSAIEYETSKIISDNDIRAIAGRKQLNGSAWRCGAIWATQNRYNNVIPTVDCAIFDDESYKYCWMAKKLNESKFRFVGGFADPNKDKSFEDTAKREAFEETGIVCKKLKYVCSTVIDDWRFKNESDKIVTTFFTMIRESGVPKADDDISELYKVDIANLSEENVQEEHIVLLKALKEKINNF